MLMEEKQRNGEVCVSDRGGRGQGNTIVLEQPEVCRIPRFGRAVGGDVAEGVVCAGELAATKNFSLHRSEGGW